jgi:hypothetical protein
MKQPISYSAVRKFCNCRKAYYFRYKLRIEPLRSSDALSFGKLIHECLAARHDTKNKKSIVGIIRENYPDTSDKWQAHHRALAFGMMKGYAKQYDYTDGNRKTLNTELEYNCPIINPKTGRQSRKYGLHGFIDMVEARDNEVWLWEHKTASTLNEGYISRLWHDLQIMIYALAYERMTGKKVKGIVYNIIQKVKLKQGKKESFDEFSERIEERYLTDESLFHREEILTDNLRLDEVERELWQITQDIGKCKDFYKNRSQCYGFGECEFFKICNSGNNPLIIQNYYKEREDDITNRKEQEETQPF